MSSIKNDCRSRKEGRRGRGEIEPIENFPGIQSLFICFLLLPVSCHVTTRIGTGRLIEQSVVSQGPYQNPSIFGNLTRKGVLLEGKAHTVRDGHGDLMGLFLP